MLSEGKVTNYELTARARDGTLTVVSYNATTFHDRDRRLQGVFASARDMTELKAIEQALTQKNAELEDASRMKSEFLANMSHELRTPLNAIIGFSEVLGDGLLGDMTEKQRRFIGDIFKSGKHLLSLINDILDLSKVEAGKMLLDLDTVEIAPLLSNSLSIVKGQAAVRHVRLDMRVAEELGTLTADARKVKQIVYNLLSNAVKFTADGGDVILRADRVSRDDVGVLTSDWAGRTFPLAASDFSEFLRLSVTDNGIGMSPEGLEQLFKPFSQVDSGLARQFEGTGLGLAMVKLLVDLHGGVVAVESAVGKGSCFTVWIPMRARSRCGSRVAEAAGRRSPHEASGGSAHRARRREQLQVRRVDQGSARGGELHGDPRAQRGGGDRRRAARAARADHARHHDARRRRLGVPRAAQEHSVARFRSGGHHLDSRRSDQGLRARRGGGDAVTGLATGAVRHARRCSACRPCRAISAIRVLVVDDDPKAVELIAVRIGGMASEIFRALGGREAIEIARRELPDLIVLDLIMPDVNGFDVVEALNAQSGDGRHPGGRRHGVGDHRRGAGEAQRLRDAP